MFVMFVLSGCQVSVVELLESVSFEYRTTEKGEAVTPLPNTLTISFFQVLSVLIATNDFAKLFFTKRSDFRMPEIF